MVEHLRLDDVDAGVDRVGEDLTPSRLLQEALDAPLLIDDHHSELEGVRHALERDGDESLPLLVETDHLGQVEVGERIAADDQERLREELLGQTDRLLPSPKWLRMSLGRKARVMTTSVMP